MLTVRLFTLLITLFSLSVNAQNSNPINLSIRYLYKIKTCQSTAIEREALANLSEEQLARSLNNHPRRLAFWINLYNASVQHTLGQDSSLYEDKDDYFGRDQIKIAGHTISLDMIEHGLLRHSKIKYGLGYFNKWFISDFEEKFRLPKADPRIHFTLNCGARSCPPIPILRPATVNWQLNQATATFLKQTTEIRENEIWVTPLMSWFRGDFDNRIAFLKQHGILPKSSRLNNLEYQDYDWSLHLGAFSK